MPYAGTLPDYYFRRRYPLFRFFHAAAAFIIAFQLPSDMSEIDSCRFSSPIFSPLRLTPPASATLPHDTTPLLMPFRFIFDTVSTVFEY